MKKSLSVIFLSLFVLCLFSSCSVESVEKHYSTTTNKASYGTAALTINCSDVLENLDKLDKSVKDSNVIPKDGNILKEKTFDIQKDDTAYSFFLRAAKAEKIAVDYLTPEESSYGSAYIKGIGNLYEKNCGDTSGWLFLVNGNVADKACSDYKLQKDDKIEFLYICDMNAYFSTQTTKK